MAEVGTLTPCMADITTNTTLVTSVSGDALETHIVNGDSVNVILDFNVNGVAASETGALPPTEDPPALIPSRLAAAPGPASRLTSI